MRRFTDPDWITDEQRLKQDLIRDEQQVEQAVEQVEQVAGLNCSADLKASTVQLLFPTLI
jgi:hypothetical protein